MKDEIKEILDRVKKHYVLDEIQDILLLDYITNLQQKEELLRQEISDVRKAFNGLQQENERLKKALCKHNIVPKCKYDYLKRQKEGLELNLSCIKDYKSRCEKAINYIEASKINRYVYALDFNTLLNILRGDE